MSFVHICCGFKVLFSFLVKPNHWNPFSISASLWRQCHLRSFLLGGSVAPREARKLKILWWWKPEPAARTKAFIPLSVVRPKSAPDFTSTRTTPKCPCSTAKCNGVHPSSVVGWSLLAPASTRKRTISRWPCWAARCSGVNPWSFAGWSLFAPASARAADFKMARLSCKEKRWHPKIRCLLHLCLHLPQAVGAEVQYVPSVQHGVGAAKVSHHSHLGAGWVRSAESQ